MKQYLSLQCFFKSSLKLEQNTIMTIKIALPICWQRLIFFTVITAITYNTYEKKILKKVQVKKLEIFLDILEQRI